MRICAVSGSRAGRLLAPAMLVVLAACGGGEGGGTGGAPPPPPPSGGPTAFQLEHGLGPITEVVALPDAVDHALAETGEAVFAQKCAACHKLGERYVGPALGDVLDRRSPAFVMNMILNPQQMIEEHPVVKELLAQYMSFMPNQNVTRDEARAIVEYFRTATP